MAAITKFPLGNPTDEVTFVRLRITPSMAKQALRETASLVKLRVEVRDGVFFQQRAVNKPNVQKLVRAIDTDVWHDNTGDTIKISFVEVDGVIYSVVIDGQHRLQAIISTGKSLKCWVALGVPLDAFPFLDQHFVRDCAQIMETEGWENPKLCATMARLWYKEDQGGDPNKVTDETRANDASIVEYCIPLQELFYSVIDQYKTRVQKAVRQKYLLHNPGALYQIARMVDAAEGDFSYTDTLMDFFQEPVLGQAPSAYWARLAGAMNRIGLMFEKEASEGSTITSAVQNGSKSVCTVYGLALGWEMDHKGGKPKEISTLVKLIRASEDYPAITPRRAVDAEV